MFLEKWLDRVSDWNIWFLQAHEFPCLKEISGISQDLSIMILCLIIKYKCSVNSLKPLIMYWVDLGCGGVDILRECKRFAHYIDCICPLYFSWSNCQSFKSTTCESLFFGGSNFVCLASVLLIIPLCDSCCSIMVLFRFAFFIFSAWLELRFFCILTSISYISDRQISCVMML